jgi:positive regulator of sigma E activity
LCSPKSGEDKIIKLENSIDCKVGDAVEISEASNVLLILSMLQYGLPLLGFLTGIFISYNINIDFKPIELFQFIVGMLGFGIAAGISYLIIKGIAKKPDKLYSVRKI